MGGGGKGMMMPMMMNPLLMKMMFGKGKGKGKKGLNKAKPECKVWIGNLPESVSWKELKEHFDQAGKTKWVEAFTKGEGKGTGGVAYGSEEDAQRAISTLNGSVL